MRGRDVFNEEILDEAFSMKGTMKEIKKTLDKEIQNFLKYHKISYREWENFATVSPIYNAFYSQLKMDDEGKKGILWMEFKKTVWNSMVDHLKKYRV
jgi:tryptophanyl-tRNA synthetase